MNKDSFDKALKNKLPDSAADFDVEAAWTDLELRRRKQPKRRGLVWWFWAAGFALLLGGGATWWWSAQPVAKQITTGDQIISDDRVSKGDHGSADDHVFAGDRKGRPYGASHVIETPSPANDIQPATEKPETSHIPNASDATTVRSTVGATLAVAQHKADTHPLAIVKPQPVAKPKSVAKPEFSLKPVAQIPPAERYKRRKAPKWSVGAQVIFGTNQVRRSGMPDYVAVRNQEEKTLDMFQGGLDVRRQLNRHLFIQTGIQYAQWTDVRRSVQTTESTRPDSNLLLERIIYPDGSIENVFGPGEVKVLSTTKATRYNRYRHIEVPVVAGLAFPVGSRWQLEAAAGLAIGLVSRHSGSATIGDQTFALDDLPYRNSGTLSATGSIAWMYRNSRWAAGLALMGRSELTSSTGDRNLFTEKRWSAGMGLVLRRMLR
ncbi:MAG: hypothetical protein H6574_11245 [Lewinellaceae bacterium]|nr:hypothetical protein [Lewinellaceae bacterium]